MSIKTTIAGLLAALAGFGCAITHEQRPYDPVEYDYAISITVDATRAIHRCEDTSAEAKDFWSYVQLANTDSFKLQEFVDNRANSDQVVPAVTALRRSVVDVLERGTFSPTYCVLKLTNVQASSRIISRALGHTDRAAVCDGGIGERYAQFSAAYTAGQINVSEYKELVNDVVRLEQIDQSGCSIAIRVQMQKDLQLIEKALPAILSL